jgi:hypothetical protein
MELDVLLCNHAEVAENKLFVTGGGVNMCLVAPSAPHVVTIGLGCVIHVPYQATNHGHTFEIELLDEDGHAVTAWVPEGAVPQLPVYFKQEFNVGRPPMIQVGDEQTFAVGVNITNLPLERVGLYEFIVKIDGEAIRRMPVRVMPMPASMLPNLPAAS